jgi:predicted outer membrane repeat protein
MKSFVRGFLPRPRSLAAALSLALIGVATPPSVVAHTTAQLRTVQNCDDSGPGSLRDVYASAQDGDEVSMTQLACSTITLTSGPITSGPNAGYVVLQGPLTHSLTVSGNHAGRVIVHHGSNLGVRNLYIAAGFANDAGGGGCIYSSAKVVLTDSTVSDCEVSTSGVVAARGGGIRALGAVVLRTSRVTGNRAHAAAADADGGGLHALYLVSLFQSTIGDNTASSDGSHFARGGGAFASGYLRCDDTTFSGNGADSGGAIYVGNSNQFNMPPITNVTISGNSALGAAGGLFAGRSIKVFNSTITGNGAGFDFGAGIYMSAGDVELHSTIVANNTTGGGLNAADVAGHAGATITGAHNLVIASTLALPADTISAEPMLGPLAENSGRAFTHALLPGSPAIDKGENPKGLTHDERGFFCPPDGQCVQAERTIGAATDIGAFELGGFDRIFHDAFEVGDN